MSIQMPNEEEKKRSIRFIVDSGVLPEKRFRAPELIRAIGLRNLFWGTWDCMFLALLGSVVLGVFLAVPSARDQTLLPTGLLLLSPAVYSLFHFLVLWKERQEGLYEMKMTCRYTLRELTALRMAFFGGASALADMLFVWSLRQQGDMVLSFFQMSGISLSALFLYGTGMLLALSHLKGRYQWAVPAAWCGICIAPMVSGVDLTGFLLKIPGAAALFAAFLSALVFFAGLERGLCVNIQGGKCDAVC